MVQHVAITDPQIHEPKGVAAASANYVYVSDGAGSGSWKKVDSLLLKSLAGDGGSSNLRLVSDGTNGFTLKTNAAYGCMASTSNTNNFAITAAADTTLLTASQYSLFTGTGAPWASENLLGITFATDRLTVPVAGIYKLDVWGTVTAFPSATAKVGLRHKVNATTSGTRFSIAKSGAAGDICVLAYSEILSLSASDYVQMMVASDATGNIVIQNMAVMLNLIKAA